MWCEPHIGMRSENFSPRREWERRYIIRYHSTFKNVFPISNIREEIFWNPSGRLLHPDEIAAAILWLCGPGSDAVTGQAIAVSGGQV